MLKNSYYRWVIFWPLMLYDLIRWIINHRQIPLPFLLKRHILLSYIKNNNLDYFIETGTCYGDMLAGIKNHVEKAVSVEIDENLHHAAQNRFINDEHVKIILGDSADILPAIVKEIDKPTLFYLDAHYSGSVTGRGKTDTPLLSELKLLSKMNMKNHVILIDDARHLGKNGYPTFFEIKELFDLKEVSIRNKKDIIRIEPYR